MGGPEEQQLSHAALVRSRIGGDDRFAVTGASGWLGRTTLDLLHEALGRARFASQVTAYAGRARTIELRDGIEVRLRGLDELVDQYPPPDYIAHFAYLTRDQVGVLGTDAFVRANLAITTAVVHAVDRLRPKGVFSASSGAVYGRDGRLATDLAANTYGSLKHIDELALRQAAHDVSARSVVARIFSISGPYMTKPHLYALGGFILQALAGGPLVVEARHPVYRSYVGADDIAALALGHLLGEDEPEDLVFDTGGELVEIGELAHRVGLAVGSAAAMIRREWDPNATADRYAGDGHRMQALAAGQRLALRRLDEQILRTADYLSALGPPTAQA